MCVFVCVYMSAGVEWRKKRRRKGRLSTHISALSGIPGNFPTACTTPNVGYRPIVYFLWYSSSFSQSLAPSCLLISPLRSSLRAPPASPIHPSCLLSHSLFLFLLLFYFYLSLLALTALLQLSSSHRIIPPSHTPVLIPSYHPRRETQACSLADGCVRALVRVCRRRPSRYPVYVCVLATEHTPASLDVGGVIRSKRPKRKGDEEEKSGERVRQEGCGNTGK